MKIRRQDKILVILGKDRNKTGIVEKTHPTNNTVLVEGINIYKRHIKPSKRNPQGGIIDVVKPIKISNISVICPHCSKATRIGIKTTEKGKVRICRHCQESLDQE